MALGLPIKMVALTIVGMAGLAAMIGIINSSQDIIPKPMHANIKIGNLIILQNLSDNDTIEIPIEVICSKDGTPVKKANVALFGLKAASINLTDSDGKTMLTFNKRDFDIDANEGYLRLDVRATGFNEYINEYAVKIII